MAPYDTVAYMLEKLTKVRYKYMRIFCDFVFVIATYFVAIKINIQWQLIGVGTIVMATCVGPLLMYFKDNISNLIVLYLCGEN